MGTRTIWGRTLFGTVAQNLSDVVIMGEKSDVEYYANALENAGFTEEEAKKMALKEFFLNNPVRNSTTAFVSNAIVSGANSAVSGYRKLAEIYENADGTVMLTEGEDSGRINEDTDMLFKELENSGVKFSKKDTLFTTKDRTGQIVWLENGNENTGLTHILIRHTKDFQNKHGIYKNQITNHLNNAISYGNVEYNRMIQRNGRNGYERLYLYDGNYYLLSGIGTNGYVVSAYPIGKDEAWKLIRRYRNEQ